MHSTEYLLKEVNDKLDKLQLALSLCESEKLLLKRNLDSVKDAVADSFKRHIGTLQCRAKWLVCHADSIFHLKEGCLIQQIAELEQGCDELKSVLDLVSKDKVTEEIEQAAMNVLNSLAPSSIQPCENGGITFLANDSKMEEMIISFGDIEADSMDGHCLNDEALSDEGIFVVESPCKKKRAIGVSVQSGNSENDFERVDMELIIPVSKDDPNSRRQSQNDSAYEECTDSKSDEWLYHPNIATEKTSTNFSNSTDKVPLWLINCDETANPWIRQFQSNSAKSTKVESDEQPASDSIWLKENQMVQDVSIDVNSLPKSPPCIQSLEEVRGSTNVDKFDHILRSPDSMYLRPDVNSDLSSYHIELRNALNSMTLTDEQRRQEVKAADSMDFDANSCSEKTNIDQANVILEAPHSHYLRSDCNKEGLTEALIKSTNAVNHLAMLGSRPDKMFLHQPTPAIIDPSICDWLRGESTDMCAQCYDVCGYGSRFDETWLKTATDW